MRCLRPLFHLLLLLLIFFTSSPAVFGQGKHLSVYKSNGTIAKRYIVGDQIKLKNSRGTWISGELEQLWEDTLILAGLKMGLSEVHAVRVTRSGLLGTGINLGTAGLLWPGIVIINGITSGSRPLLTPNAAISSAGLLAAGVTLSALALRTYSTKEAGKLRIVDFNFTLPKNNPIHEPSQPN